MASAADSDHKYDDHARHLRPAARHGSLSLSLSLSLTLCLSLAGALLIDGPSRGATRRGLINVISYPRNGSNLIYDICVAAATRESERYLTR